MGARLLIIKLYAQIISHGELLPVAFYFIDPKQPRALTVAVWVFYLYSVMKCL